MTGSLRNSCVQIQRDDDQRRRTIRRLNDALRRTGRGGIICMTAGVRELGEERVAEILIRIRDFDSFTTRNDPYGEHEIGVLNATGRRVMWKIDYYDLEQRHASPAPDDPMVTTRVLTILLASEY